MQENFYHMDGAPTPPDIEEDLGQLLVAVDNSLDFIHNGPRVQVTSPEMINEQYDRHVVKIIPRVKSILASRVCVQYPLSDLVDMSYRARNGYTKGLENDPAHALKFDPYAKLYTSGKHLLHVSSQLAGHTRYAQGERPDGGKIMLGLADMVIDMQQIMRLFGWTWDDVKTAARVRLSELEQE